jgi:tetratricopeptide (TPR) repeat protein
MDLAMRGQALVFKLVQQSANEKEINHAAQALFEQALKIDPNDGDALAGAAYTYFLDRFYEWTTTGADYEGKILGQLDRAIALDPDNLWAYYVKSQYLVLLSKRARESLSAADAGLAINPNYAPLYVARSTAENALGRYEQAKSDVQQAMRLSPRDPRIGLWLIGFGRRRTGPRPFRRRYRCIP